jgi:hypothetical protein
MIYLEISYYMTTLVSFIVFIVILFLYIHITAHYKKSEDMEIYEADYNTNKQLQEICDLRQPIMFDFAVFPEEKFDLDKITAAAEKSEFDIRIKDITDIYRQPEYAGDSVLLPFRSAYGLIETDKKSKYFSENNEEFVKDCLELQELDEYFKPSFTAQSKYDILIGSDKAYTPCRYHTDYRKFLFVKSGKIQVKMTPWKSHKYLHPENDYVNYEFRSPIDIWTPQSKYEKDMENMRFLDFEVLEGYTLYVPPYWWYSIRFICGENHTPTFIESFSYNSIMCLASNIPTYGMYFLQQMNLTTKVLKKLDTNRDNDSDDDTPHQSSNTPPSNTSSSTTENELFTV